MPIKVCFENEIHRFSKLFPSLESFTAHMASSFQTQLPQSWAPSYINSEGINIVITSESDYQNLFENYSKDSSVTLRLYIVTLNPNMNALEGKNIAKEEKLEQVQFVNDQNEVIPIAGNTQPTEVIDVQDIKQDQAVSNDDLPSQHQREKTLEINEHAAFEQKQNGINKPQADPQPKKVEDRLDQLKKMVEKLILGKFPEDKVEIAKMKIQKLEATLTSEQKEELNKKREQVEKVIIEKKAKLEKAAAKLLQKQAKAKMEVNKDAPSEPIQSKEETKQQEDVISEQKVQSTTPQPAAQKAVVKQMKCGGCNVSLTSGIAYKCSQCLDFNFCESCEATKEHPHLFLKIKDVGLFTENNAKAVKKPECPYAAFQKLMEDLKKGNLEQVQKCYSKYLTKLSEEARKTLISLFENIPEENKEKVKEALIELKEKAFGKDNCSCVEEREKLKEAQRLFKEEKTAFAKAQKESKLKLKEELSAFKTTKKAETEKLKAEWQKLKEKKKEDAEKLKEEWKKIKDAGEKEKKKEAAAKSSVVKEKNQPKDEKKESVLAENVEIEDLLI